MVLWWRYSVSSIIHVNTYHDPAADNLPRRPRGAEVPPSASSLRTPRADTTGSRALVLVCVAKQARANELIAEGDGYTFIAAQRSPDLRHTSKRRRHLCYCGNE
jgi:hypothetical protein